MIKYIYFSLLLIAGLTLTACSSDDNSVEQAPKIYYMTVDATKGVNEAASPAYRRALNLSGSTLSASWATTEHVYVQVTLANLTKDWFKGSLQPQSAGVTTRLSGTLSVPDGWVYSTIESAKDNGVFEFPIDMLLHFPRPGDLDYTGQVGTIDGVPVIKAPTSYFPVGVDFVITNAVAMVSPIKLQDYKIHIDPPGINGALVEGRLRYSTYDDKQGQRKYVTEIWADNMEMLSPKESKE